jgi:hypothetical protein
MRTLIVLCALLSFAAVPARADADRDGARKAILDEELAAEAKQFIEAYGELQARPASARNVEDLTERLNRHRRNMAELAREIARDEGDVASKAGRSRTVSDDWLIQTAPSKGQAPDWLVPAERRRR